MQFLRDALGISYIRYDKSRHVSKGGDSFGQIAAGRILKIEKYRRIVALAKLLLDGVQDGLTLGKRPRISMTLDVMVSMTRRTFSLWRSR